MVPCTASMNKEDDDPWWSPLIRDDLWWSVMIRDDPWWSVMIRDDPWRSPLSSPVAIISLTFTAFTFITVTFTSVTSICATLISMTFTSMTHHLCELNPMTFTPATFTSLTSTLMTLLTSVTSAPWPPRPLCPPVGYTAAYPDLVKQTPPVSLISLPPVISIVVQMGVIITFQVLTWCYVRSQPWSVDASHASYTHLTRGGTIHRCIDISRYFSRDTYRDIIFYNHNFFLYFFLVHWFSFRQKRYIILSTCIFCKVIPQIHNYFVKIFCEISISRN